MATAPEEFRSIRIDKEQCAGRMACMRVCPTEAIRVRDRRAFLLPDKCIDCGECVRVCPNHAIVPQTSSFRDFSRFKYTIALPSPVFYSQFGRGVLPASILKALKKVGFDDSYDVACASESVSIAIQEFLDSNDSPRPLISPFCPTIVRLVQIRYPNLLDHLIPIESPMEIAAREAKHVKMRELGLKEHEIGVIYLTPCPAKTIAIRYPPRKKHSFLDGAIAISEIYPTVVQALSQIGGLNGNSSIRGLGLGWPMVGGQVSSLKAEECLAIAGLADVIRILEDIENGKLKDIQYIECNSCPTACVGGSLTVENPYIARGRVLRMIEQFGSKPCQDLEKIRRLYRRKFFSLPGKIPAHPVQPLDQDVSMAIQKLQGKHDLYEKLPKIDCGACGSPTCLTFAEDVVKGSAALEDCVFLAMRKFASMSSSLLETVESHSRKVPYQTDFEKS
ncbi:MAG: 4Fe-4S dicluster domain-containing protein [Ignavibacteria bacterium]|nr:4Fe-4S dicluster domain-containing protein [Ignavibacteria bacterium]